MADPRPGAHMPAADVRRRLASELGLPSRLGYTALLLAGISTGSVAAALLLTEEGLPARTRVALTLVVLIGLAWAVFAVWVLARRRVLLAQHRVIATGMAVAFTTVFTGGALLVALQSGPTATALSVTGGGVAMWIIALVLHLRARRRVQQLMLRRRELERRLADADGEGAR